jgi:hypothetical protein
MTEQAPQSPRMPSGYESSLTLPEQVFVDQDILPWVEEPFPLTISEFTLQGGESFKMASAIGSHQKLIEAAKAMTEGQRRNTDNMFYSRIPIVVSQGYSPNVETMQNPTTDFPIFVMRNNGGQRVYFGRTNLNVGGRESEPVIIRLAACDKNKQALVMPVLSAEGYRQKQRKRGK